MRGNSVLQVVQRYGWVLVAAFAVPMGWHRRGAGVGIFDIVLCAMLTVVAVGGPRWMRWMSRNRVASYVFAFVFIGSMGFFASANLTPWRIGYCLLASAGFLAATVAVTVWRAWRIRAEAR